MKDKINKIYNGNNIKVLKGFEENCIDSIITDFPYGLQDVDALKLIKENKNNTKGFLNKEWDCLPSIEMLQEFFRVLKTGGWLITTFTPRQDLQCILQYRLLEAGFDISFSSTYWAYASGFPKACNYGKVADRHLGADREIIGYSKQGVKSIFDGGKERPVTIPAKYIDGLYSNSLKPAVEIIIVAQKPFKEPKFKQALKWHEERQKLLEKGVKEEDLSLYTKNASGGVRIDDCKIPTNELIEKEGVNSIPKKENLLPNITRNKNELKEYHTNGRFPTNLLVSDDVLDVGCITKSVKNTILDISAKKEWSFNVKTQYKRGASHTNAGDFSRYFSVDAWTKKHLPELYKLNKKCLTLEKDAEKIFPFLNVAKPFPAEKNLGLDEFEEKNINDGSIRSNQETGRQYGANPALKRNTHPTSKPISLFAYLVALYSSENDIILDPFCGSGTTCIASVLTNRKFIGIDITEEYCKIAEARIEYWRRQKEESDAHKQNMLL